MNKYAGIAAIAFAVHAGLAWAQPVVIEPEGAPGRAERAIPRETPMRAPAEAAPGSQQRPESAPKERREVQSNPSRGPEEGAQPRQRERTQEPSPMRAPSEKPPQTQDRNQAQREQTEPRTPSRPGERAQLNGRSSDTAQPAQMENRNAPATARPAPSEPGNKTSDTATQPQSPDARPQMQAQPRNEAPGQQNQASGQPRTDAPDSQRIAETVRESIGRNEIRPVKDFGVSVTVGARLPSRIDLRPLPRDIVDLRPQYRNYRYTVSDREVVIVDPGSRRIVEVIDRDGGRFSGGGLYAAFEGRRDVRRWHRPDTVVFETGVVLPAGVPLSGLPTEVVERNPNWRGYQYVMTETDEVAIVEPRSHRIVEVVGKSAATASAPRAQAAPVAANSAPPSASTDRHDLAKLILREARPGEIQGVDGLKGAVLPSDLMIQPLPAEVEQRDPQLRGYQYTLIGDDVLIVDPQTRRVVDVIE